MDNNDLKKWLAEQISYLEHIKANRDKFAWDPEYDLQLSAFRLALERLEPVGPLTLEQLREVPHGKIKDCTLQSICDRANEIAFNPANIDRKAWKPCSESCRKNCMNCDHNADELFGDADYCKDCHRCSKWETSVHKYCERCGRPRSEEAWADLEKRLRW